MTSLFDKLLGASRHLAWYLDWQTGHKACRETTARRG
jgi:hypothetical protein